MSAAYAVMMLSVEGTFLFKKNPALRAGFSIFRTNFSDFRARLHSMGLGSVLNSVFSLESFDSSCSINQFLLTSEKRVAA